MRATVMYKAGDVRIESVPDPKIQEPTDAILRITRACICGSDLWPYKLGPRANGQRMGHEAIGVVDEVGTEVHALKKDDFVIMPFAISDGTCDLCRDGLPTACVHGGFFGVGAGPDGAQAEALRVPHADGTLFRLPVRADEALMPALLTLTDVMGTGHHAALTARVRRGRPAAIIGDGAVGLCAVIAAKRLGADPIILLGRHPDRIALGRKFGAMDIVTERGEEAVERVRALTGGFGSPSVLECVGSEDAMRTAMGIVRAGGAVGRVGVPHYESIAGAADTMFYRNITVSGGPAPVRAYIEELLPDILEGRIDPGCVFDRAIGLEEIPDGYREMNERASLKVMIKP